MRHARLSLLVAAAVLVSGCLSSATLVRVERDGSGTIDQTLLVNTQALKAMLPGFDPGGGRQARAGLMGAEDLERMTARMGEGVRVVSSEPIVQGGFEGIQVRFAFDDISRLRLDPEPLLAGGTGLARAPAARGASPVSFALARQPAGTSLLTVRLEEPSTSGGAPPQDAPGPAVGADPQMLQMLQAMFAGFRVAIDLEVSGTIVRTNADHVSGSRVTLLELDMDTLVRDEVMLKELQARVGPGASLTQIRPLVKNVPGLKVNQPVVTIEFR